MSFLSSMFYRATVSDESRRAPVGRVTRTLRSGTRIGRNDAGTIKQASDIIHDDDVVGLVQVDGGRSIEEAVDKKVQVIQEILLEHDLYSVLKVKPNATNQDIRRAFLTRSRSCHPDKFPEDPNSTIAFQKLAFAYQTLCKPASRQAYDFSPDSHAMFNGKSPHDAFDDEFGDAFADATLQDVLFSVYVEFFEGEFTSVKALLKVLADSGLGTYSDANISRIEAKFRMLSRVMRATRRYSRVVLNEMSRLYEIQHDLRRLSYLDIPGRLRLTLELARVTLSIPLAIDHAMQNADDYDRNEFAHWFDHMRAHSEHDSQTHEHESKLEREFGLDAEVGGEAPGSDEHARMRYVRARDARIARRAAQRRHAGTDSDANRDADAATLPTHQEVKHQTAGFLGATTTALFTRMVNVLEAGEAWMGGRAEDTL